MRLGFIGAGNMAQAMIGGVLGSGILQKDDVIASAATQETIGKVQQKYGIHTTLDNREVAQADIVFLAVKPVYCEQVIEEIKGTVSGQQIIVSIAAGKTMAWLEEKFGEKRKLIRTMPNTPALVGEGITAVCPNENVNAEELQSVCKILESFGRAEVIQESMMDAVIAVSGSSPAYVFLFIEAMADAAVAEGMSRAKGYGMFTSRYYHRGSTCVGTRRIPWECNELHEGLCGQVQKYVVQETVIRRKRVMEKRIIS